MTTVFISLRKALAAAVPQRMRELKNRGGPSKEDRAASVLFLCDCSQNGSLEDFLDPGLRTGRTPELFNRLAFSLAALAFDEGGIDLFGMHWQNGLTALPD